MTGSRSVSVSLAIIATAVVFYVLAVGRQLLVPLAVAVVIWYIINAMSRVYARALRGAYERANWITLTASLVTIGVLTSLLVQLIQDNLAEVSSAAPVYKARLDALLTRAYGWLGLDQVPTVSQVIGSVDIAPAITKFAAALTGIIGNVGLIVIYVLFLLLEQKTFERKLARLFPNQRQQNSVRAVLVDIQSQIQSYLWIKTLVSMVTGVVAYVVFRLVGLDLAEFWAVTVFLLNYIPTIGSIVATVFPALLALIQFDTLTPFVIVAAGLFATQFVIGNVVEPRLMGSTLNLSPLVVLLALALWGSVWGIAGMFLCVPITVIALIILAHFDTTRPLAILLSESGRLRGVQQDDAAPGVGRAGAIEP